MIAMVVILLGFALFVWLAKEPYKKFIRKDRSSILENRLVPFALSAIFGWVCFLVLDASALPEEIRFSPALIVVFTVLVYILQLPACMKL
ncbi:MAG: hypothetical protein PHI83_06715 [Sphaerochaetaceae bacterium]|jgi:heme/copper-type cytochrome/quinol oxidase subunit 4|nr:hypothetical protein [Sphaerochaetaceae bacterium]